MLLSRETSAGGGRHLQIIKGKTCSHFRLLASPLKRSTEPALGPERAHEETELCRALFFMPSFSFSAPCLSLGKPRHHYLYGRKQTQRRTDGGKPALQGSLGSSKE